MTVSVRSLKTKRPASRHSSVTPGVSRSPDSVAPAPLLAAFPKGAAVGAPEGTEPEVTTSAPASSSIAAPPKGAAPGAPADPSSSSSSSSEDTHSPSGAVEEEERDQLEEDRSTREVAAPAQRGRAKGEGDRPPAVCLRGRVPRSRSPAARQAQSRPPPRISLVDRPVVLRPANPQYPSIRTDRQGTWSQVVQPGRPAPRIPFVSREVPIDRFDWGADPFERDEEIWRDPSARTRIYVHRNSVVHELETQDAPTDTEQDTADADYLPGHTRARERAREEQEADYEEVEAQFLAEVRSLSETARPARSVHLVEEGVAEGAPVGDSGSSLAAPAEGAAPSAPSRRSSSKIPRGYRQSQTPSPPAGEDNRAAPSGAQDWFREEPTNLETRFPRERSPRTRKPPPPQEQPKAPVIQGYKDPPSCAKVLKSTPKFKGPPKSIGTPPPGAPVVGQPPPVFGSTNPPQPPPAPARKAPSNANPEVVVSRPDPPELPKGAAPSAPEQAQEPNPQGVADRAPQNGGPPPNPRGHHQVRFAPHQPPEPDISVINRHGSDYRTHCAGTFPGVHDDNRIVIAIDWYKTITPLLLHKSFWAPTPLFAQQLKDLSSDYPVQFIIISFSGFQGVEQTEWEISNFTAYCNETLGVPFVGYLITKAPLGDQGKAIALSDFEVAVFIDDRGDILNEVRRTGCKVFQATGSDRWVRELNDYLRSNSQNDYDVIRRRIATPLRREQYSVEPPGRNRGE